MYETSGGGYRAGAVWVLGRRDAGQGRVRGIGYRYRSGENPGHQRSGDVRCPVRRDRRESPQGRQRAERGCGRGQHWRERSEEHTSELQSLAYLVCRLLLEKKKNIASPV